MAAKNKNRGEEHIEGTRRAQDFVGKILEGLHDQNLVYQTVMFRNFIGSWVAPKEQVHDGVIIYLHGGGYCCGNMDYAKGFASVLADKYKIRVFTVAYRLAPEYPFPAALEDAMDAYKYILNFGYAAEKIVLMGESAGGGLVNCLCIRLKNLGMPLPCGIISFSPWVDLTLSGESFENKAQIDVALTPAQVEYYAKVYTGGENCESPYISPLFGDLSGFPPSIIVVGSDEILFSDAQRFYEKLKMSGARAELIIGEGLWHVYPFYGIKESKPVFDKIREFLHDAVNERI